MEIVFLIILILIMVLALGGGFPVAFALPGSAILTIALAAVTGVVFEGDPSAYFVHGGPLQWLSAGVTNFRGIYWEAERDTLIAVPLFIFMGIMLERSKIAEDLLVTMAQLFGPVPGGLGISVVIVGALLAATTGIVGATVIAMGLISLPVMLRANYSHSLATGTINASGTLGQIIPPSIVLIILADQLSNATDQASAIRTADYKLVTGNVSLPTEFDLTSTSAGDMFLGAFLPGMVLVGLYIAYILVTALLRPHLAPPAPYLGKYDRTFAWRVFIVLVPPLALIFTVLGSIVMGVATVNQAGALGAVGAMVMAGYRLVGNHKGAYYPAVMAITSIIALVIVLSIFDINVKNIQGAAGWAGVLLAAAASMFFLISLVWSGWRAYRIDNTLQGVMVETAKTTSLVFIILLGAAMLTAAFRAFGGEELVKDFLTGLPGGFVTKFVVVMGVIFVLGFFLDFIEIAVVVVPIVAPILLADPTANVTAVWLGVMVGVNMQTSFLTPPFGFALFYLRGVAPPKVRTIEMYKGVVPFIALQLVGLTIVGFSPVLVNYLPNRVYLTSDTAPPPRNPRLQACLEEYLFDVYDRDGGIIRAAIADAGTLPLDGLPDKYKESLETGLAKAAATFGLVERVKAAQAAVAAFVPGFAPLHAQVRDIRVETAAIDRKLKRLARQKSDIARFGTGNGDGTGNDAADEIRRLEVRMEELARRKDALNASAPVAWRAAHEEYVKLAKAETKARRAYRRNVDDAYEPVQQVRKLISGVAALAALEGRIQALESIIATAPGAEAIAAIKAAAGALGDGASKIKSKLNRARRAMKGDTPKRDKAARELAAAMDLFTAEVAWRRQAAATLGAGLATYDAAIGQTIGIRLQERLSLEQAKEVASCLSVHRDISLNF